MPSTITEKLARCERRATIEPVVKYVEVPAKPVIIKDTHTIEKLSNELGAMHDMMTEQKAAYKEESKLKSSIIERLEDALAKKTSTLERAISATQLAPQAKLPVVPPPIPYTLNTSTTVDTSITEPILDKPKLIRQKAYSAQQKKTTQLPRWN